MTQTDIDRIERDLDVKLPPAYRELMCASDAARLGDAGIFDNAALVVERTKRQRAGFDGAPAWATKFVYVGDQDDDCPYALNVDSGAVVRSDHGDLFEPPLARYNSFSNLAAELLAALELESRKSKWWMFWKK